MSAAARIAAFAGAVLTATLVLLVFHLVARNNPLGMFGSHWTPTSLMSSLVCPCALRPGTQCFNGDWGTMVEQHTAVNLMTPNVSMTDFAHHAVCEGTPALILGCARPDLRRHPDDPSRLMHISSEDRHHINSIFMELMEDTMDGCDGDLMDVEYEDVNGGMPGDGDDSHYDRYEGAHDDEEDDDSERDDDHHFHLPHSSSDLLAAAIKAIHDSYRKHKEKYHHDQQSHSDSSESDGDARRRVLHAKHHTHHTTGPGAVDDSAPAVVRRAKFVLGTRKFNLRRALDQWFDHHDEQQDDEDEDSGYRHHRHRRSRRGLHSVDAFLEQFRGWEDGHDAIEMEITGSGWRRCMRRFVWSLQKRYTCPIGNDVVNFAHGFRAARLYTRGVQPEFDFDQHYGESGKPGAFVLQALGTTRWRVAPSPEHPVVEIVSKAGDFLYLPRGWSLHAQCFSSRCVNLDV